MSYFYSLVLACLVDPVSMLVYWWWRFSITICSRCRGSRVGQPPADLELGLGVPLPDLENPGQVPKVEQPQGRTGAVSSNPFLD